MAERTVILKPGDVFSDTLHREGQPEDSTFLLRVEDVNTDHEGQDYLWAKYAVSKSGGHASTTIPLDEGEKRDKKAILPQVFVEPNGLQHTIKKTKVPKDVKWSYEH